ncbi:MAG: hypothetical protein EXR66_02450 [Dehalococcoidia bacterium]|nr:hypothetical protein [Dehalococcoidia bacterium]
MPDHRIVAKAMNDLADDWHWVVLRDAQQLEPAVFLASTVDTICGVLIDAGPRRVRLYDTGAPSEPTCVACLEDGLDRGLRGQISEAIEAAKAMPVAR